jgi:hypothetical protein
MRLPLLMIAAALALPATAAAAPPPNDNYLASTTIASEEYRDTVDTTEATTQPDTFNPNRDGLPFGGGDPEPTSCGGASSYGKTAWWDFKAPSDGGVEIRANGGFDVVVAVHTWSERTSRITRTIRCQNDEATSESLVIPRVSAGTNYTIQVGGANGAGGPLNLEFTYFPDRDSDDVLDATDDCPRQAGIGNSGCPPELRSTPRVLYDSMVSGLRIRTIEIDEVPKNARAEVRCGRTVKKRATRNGTLKVSGCSGRSVGNGSSILVRVTLGRTGKGRYRYGAVGKYYRWPVSGGKLGKRKTRCLQPGSRKPTKCP